MLNKQKRFWVIMKKMKKICMVDRANEFSEIELFVVRDRYCRVKETTCIINLNRTNPNLNCTTHLCFCKHVTTFLHRTSKWGWWSIKTGTWRVWVYTASQNRNILSKMPIRWYQEDDFKLKLLTWWSYHALLPQN